MTPLLPTLDTAIIDAFVAAVGERTWRERLDGLRAAAAAPTQCGRRALQFHCVELALERLRTRAAVRPPTTAERLIAGYAGEAVAALEGLAPRARDGLLALLRDGLRDGECLVGAFHLLRTAATQRARGFAVQFAGLEDGAPFDLLIARDGAEAEVVCDVVSAELGRGVRRAAWLDLVDLVDPVLRRWLRLHPGRYLLKLSLPDGLREEPDALARLGARIGALLDAGRRADNDAEAVLRLDPLSLAAAQSDELGLMPRLRSEFGPEAQLAVVATGTGVFALAARAGTENAVAAAVRRRLLALAPARLSGTRPGILALFLEDTDRVEWRTLREKLQLEGEARQFMTAPEARGVVAVTCASRLELFGLPEPDGAPDGEVRFRNPAHGAARVEALGPAISSSA